VGEHAFSKHIVLGSKTGSMYISCLCYKTNSLRTLWSNYSKHSMSWSLWLDSSSQSFSEVQSVSSMTADV
jgi:hypothetical protein